MNYPGRIGVQNPDEVVRHFEEIKLKLAEMGVTFHGVLAAEMLSSGTELVVGGHIDPVSGPVVVVSEKGGVTVEGMPDNRLLLVPFSFSEVKQALAKLRIGPLLKGVRGARPLEVQAVYHAARSVAEMLEEGSVVSVDINPLITSADGAVAADALVEMRT